MGKYKILVVDDEKSMREFLSIMLGREGYSVETFSSGEAALEYFKGNTCDLVMADMKMPGMGGLKLLKAVKDINPEVTVIMITAYASVDSAVEAMKSGAYDYFIKPFNVEDIKIHIKRALEWKRLEKENILLKKDFESRYGFGNLIGVSPRMLDVYAFIKSIAPTKANVLISGESGTGKELAARAIHNESERKNKSFVAINCGAIPENLIESELFGHVKGAFTGAVVNKAGLVEMADGGTLFLDEVTELPRELQVKFLRFIQEKTVRRVGGTVDTPVDIRIIAATNRVVEDEVKAGRFREDLFFRLNVIRIEMPPLRERKEDIPHIIRHFAAKYSAELRKDAVVKDVSEEALECFLNYDYPGNVRELENAIERAVAIETKDHISKESLPDNIRNSCRKTQAALENISLPRGTHPEGRVWGGVGWVGVPEGGMDLEKTVSDFEKAMILDALKKTGGVKKKAAELLGITFRSMRHKLSKYGME